jgi:hypothetical protein
MFTGKPFPAQARLWCCGAELGQGTLMANKKRLTVNIGRRFWPNRSATAVLGHFDGAYLGCNAVISGASWFAA